MIGIMFNEIENKYGNLIKNKELIYFEHDIKWYCYSKFAWKYTKSILDKVKNKFDILNPMDIIGKFFVSQIFIYNNKYINEALKIINSNITRLEILSHPMCKLNTYNVYVTILREYKEAFIVSKEKTILKFKIYFNDYINKINVNIMSYKKFSEILKEYDIIEVYYLKTKPSIEVEIMTKNNLVVKLKTFEVDNVWTFLSKFNTLDDFLFYILENYSDALEKYKKYYNKLVWKKYKI